jgi:hypothetical protein
MNSAAAIFTRAQGVDDVVASEAEARPARARRFLLSAVIGLRIAGRVQPIDDAARRDRG